jgi:hypothetical protein
VEEENLVQHSDEVGRYFMEKLRSLQAAHPVVNDVRGRGLMIGMELSSEVDPKVSFRLAMLCEQRGLHITFTYYEPVIRFIPPLIITREEIDRAIAILDECLHLAVKEDGKVADLAPKNPRSGPLVQRMLNPVFDPVKLARKMWRTSPQEWVKKLRSVR